MTTYKGFVELVYEDLIVAEGYELVDEIQRELEEDFEDIPGVKTVKVKVEPIEH